MPRGATYYNIQLIYSGRKVLSAWPGRPSFRLRRTWLYNGRRYPTAAGRLPLVRLAWIRADLSRPLREAPARKQLVRRDEVGLARAPARRRLSARARRTAAHAGCRRPSERPRRSDSTGRHAWQSPGRSGNERLVHKQHHGQLVRDRPRVDHPLDDRLQHDNVQDQHTGDAAHAAQRRATAASQLSQRRSRSIRPRPATTATPSRTADSNGWYNHDLSVDFNGSDTTSGLESCSPDATYGGPDTSGTTVSWDLPRRRREPGTGDAAAQVRRDGAPVEPRSAAPRRERLAQPRGHRHFPGHGRHFRSRHLHADDLRRA